MFRRTLLTALTLLTVEICSPNQNSRLAAAPQPMPEAPPSGGEVRILCSFFPMYLFTKNVVGDTPGVSVQLMLPASAGCPHGYDLTPADAKKIADANIFVMNGGGLEEFDEKKLKSLNAKATIVDSVKGIKLLDADDDHEHEAAGGGHHHHHGKNPHSFSSPTTAAAMVRNIAAGLSDADSPHAEIYQKNAAAYAKKLESLGAEFKERLAAFSNKKIVTMHEIFDYLARDAGFEVVDEILTGTGVEETSPRKLIDRIRKEKVTAIFKEPQYDGKIADLVAKEAGVPVYLLDPVASGPADASMDHYEKTMKENLATLIKAFETKK